jgi:hypothetical protein
MPLPLPAIDRIFARLLAAYGRQFADLYADLEPFDVKTAWCNELSAFGDSAAGLRRIAWALDNLPDRAPNAIQFRNLVRQSPVEAAPQLPMPPANPERMREELAKLGHVEKAKRMPASNYDHKAWARRHLDMHTAGHKVRPIALLFARQALGLTREAAPTRGGA